MVIVMVGATAINHLANVMQRIRQKFRPLTILDVTQDEPRLSIIDDAPGMGGKFVVKTHEGDQLIDLSADGSESEIADIIRPFLTSGS